MSDDSYYLKLFQKHKDLSLLDNLSEYSRKKLVSRARENITKNRNQTLNNDILRYFDNVVFTSEQEEKAAKLCLGKQSFAFPGDITIVSWNINSMRSRIIDSFTAKCPHDERTIQKNSPMGKLLSETNADIIAVQETKLLKSQEDCFKLKDFYTYWNSGKKANYSGVAIFTKKLPDKVSYTLPTLKKSLHLLDEGRIVTLFYDDCVLINTYAPNTQRAGEKIITRPEFIENRINWDRAMSKYIEKLQNSGHKKIVWCGDMNVARTPKDIHCGEYAQERLKIAEREGSPKVKSLKNRVRICRQESIKGGSAGYRLTERREFEKILKCNKLIDVFRHKYPKDFGFTYWDQRRGRPWREANNGKRVDYFLISRDLIKDVRNIEIFPEIGFTQPIASDHAPLAMTICI